MRTSSGVARTYSSARTLWPEYCPVGARGPDMHRCRKQSAHNVRIPHPALARGGLGVSACAASPPVTGAGPGFATARAAPGQPFRFAISNTACTAGVGLPYLALPTGDFRRAGSSIRLWYVVRAGSGSLPSAAHLVGLIAVHRHHLFSSSPAWVGLDCHSRSAYDLTRTISR
jgi:hypothetical protein